MARHQNAQVLQNESKGVPRVNTLASMGHTGHQYQPFLTSSYEEQNCTSAPGLQLCLERPPGPEGDDAAAASQGQGMLNNGEVAPKEEI